MAKFNIKDLMQTQTPTPSRSEGNFEIEFIHIDDLIPSKDNRYTTKNIEELADSILFGKLIHNFAVERDSDGKNIIISGHRRHMAFKKLVADGHPEYNYAPCTVSYKQDDVMGEIRLIMANCMARDNNDYEKMYQAIRLKELLTQAKGNGAKITGRLRDVVSDTLQISPTKMAQMECINNNLSAPLMEAFKDGGLNFTTAYKLSGLDEKAQADATECFATSGKVTPCKKKQVEQVKEPKKQVVYEHMRKLEIDELVSFLYLNSRNTGLGLKRLREWLESEVEGNDN